jgi:nicotinamide-nucleotide amidase
MTKLEKLIRLLKKKKLTICAAESCTGGYLSYLLTKIPGSSKVFKGSLIVYSLEAKNKFLKIPNSLLKKSQGVSTEVALLLAKSMKKSLNTDISASVVGFAGPTAKKGVKPGTVFLCVTDKKGSDVKKVIIKGSRDTVRKKASMAVIDELYRRLLI